jgi:hypothetical protein
VLLFLGWSDYLFVGSVSLCNGWGRGGSGRLLNLYQPLLRAAEGASGGGLSLWRRLPPWGGATQRGPGLPSSVSLSTQGDMRG